MKSIDPYHLCLGTFHFSRGNCKQCTFYFANSSVVEIASITFTVGPLCLFHVTLRRNKICVVEIKERLISWGKFPFQSRVAVRDEFIVMKEGTLPCTWRLIVICMYDRRIIWCNILQYNSSACNPVIYTSCLSYLLIIIINTKVKHLKTYFHDKRLCEIHGY